MPVAIIAAIKERILGNPIRACVKAATIHPRAKLEPTDRSTPPPPDKITNVIPVDTSPISAEACTISIMLLVFRNVEENIEPIKNIKTKISKPEYLRKNIRISSCLSIITDLSIYFNIMSLVYRLEQHKPIHDIKSVRLKRETPDPYHLTMDMEATVYILMGKD